MNLGLGKIYQCVGSWIAFAFYCLRYKNVARPDTLLWINPRCIKGRVGNKRLRRSIVPGLIIGGKFWDIKKKSRHEMEDRAKYRSVKERYIEGKRWADTIIFREVYVSKLRRKGSARGFYCIEDLLRYYEGYDKIFRDIKENGIRPPTKANRIDPIYVSIDFDGSFLYESNGNHRLAMALVLEIEEMPVRVRARHKEWQRKRDELVSIGRCGFLKKYPNLNEHPDLF